MILIVIGMYTYFYLCVGEESCLEFDDNTHLRTQYESNGFLSGHTILSKDELNSIYPKLNELETQLFDGQFPGQWLDPNLKYEFLWNISVHPNVINILTNIFDDEFALLWTTLLCKYPTNDEHDKYGKYIGYHQDLKYWGLDPPRAITAWLAIDDTNQQNGAMIFYPKSHQNGMLETVNSSISGNLLLNNQDIDKKILNELGNVFINDLSAGKASFHHGWLVHGSPPNYSNQRRCGLTANFIDLKTKVAGYSYEGEDTRKPIIIEGNTDIDRQTKYYDKPTFRN